MTNLYLPIAPPAAGKSYLADCLVRCGFLDRNAVVEPDYYREVLTGDRANQSENGTVFAIVDRIVLTRLSHGLNVYLDATNLNKKARESLLSKIPDGTDVIIFTSEASCEDLKVRNAERSHSVPEYVINRMVSQTSSIDYPANSTVFSIEEILYSLAFLTVDEVKFLLNQHRV